MQLRKLIQFILFLIPSLAWAAGGACPSGASYINWQSPLTPVTLSSLGVTSCYYVSAAGSDSNAGTSESSPWLHAPGMPAATGNPASLNPTGGIGIIFRGGDTWHFGNSGASPYTGGTWTFSWSGSSGTPIYIGVDQTWFSGSSWARPIMNGDNPISTQAVSSCAYQTGGENILLSWAAQQYTILDNLELTGLCEASSNLSFGANNALVESGGSNNIYEHLYFHGWTHLPFSCGSGSNLCFNQGNIIGSNNPGDVHFQIVIDGSDSDPQGAGTMFLGCYNVSQSVFNNAVGMVCNQFHSFHDNLMMNMTEAGDYTSHGNVFESSGEYSGNNVFYNNVIYDVCNTPGVSCAVVGIWPEPTVGFTDYFFNNVMYNIHVANGNYFNVGQNANSGNQGTLDLWNNTFENLDAGAIINCDGSGFAEPLNLANNHYIVDLSSPYNGNCPSGTTTYTTEISKTHAEANAGGYTASQTYAYSPASSSAYTVGAGTNRIAAFCNALSSAAGTDSTLSNAASACQADTTYGVVYNSATHTVTGAARVTTTRPSSGAWDIGAYQFNGAPPPAAPVASVSPATLAFGNQATSTTGGPLTVTLSNTGNASLIIASIISSSGEFAIASNTCPPSLAAGQNCTVTVTFTPNALGAQNGTLTFTDNSSNVSGSQQTVALTGTGTSPGLWTTATSTPNFTVSWSSAGTTQTCTATQTITASQPAVLVWWGWLLGSAPTFNTVSGDSLANIAGIFQTQAAAAGGKYMFSGGAYEASAAGGSTTGSVTINTTSASGSFDCDIIQPVIASGTAILDGTASVGYQGCTTAIPCVSPTVALSGNDYALVWGAKGNPAPMAPAAPWTTPADIDSSNQYGGAFGALNQSSYSAFTFGPVSSTDYESISALSFGQSAALTVAVSPSGSGTLSCSSGNYPNGKAITCVATPGSGYGTPTWSGVSGCSGVSCTFNMNGPTSVTAVFPAVTYTLTQVISPVSSGYVTGSNCNTGSYTSGTTIGPCTATPAASYAFAGWSGGGCSGTSTCTVASLSANTTLTAAFTPTGGGSYTWTPTISPVAGGALTGTNCVAGTYTSGTTIGGCTAVAATGYTFNDWSSVSGSAGCSGATNPCASFAISSNSAATANFAQNSYTLGVTTSGSGSGTATPSATSLHYGDAYTITVTPASGSVVNSVTGCGVSPTPPYTGTMPAATCSVQVVFGIESFSWTPLILPPGSGSITGTNSVGGTYVSGTDIGALTPTPSTGYIFSSWTAVTGSADCSGSTTPCTQFALDANSTATANFTPVNSTISVSTPGGGGTVTGCAGSHAYGSIYSCAATPAANYYLQSISGCGGSGSTTYSGATPATDCNIIATFGVAQTGSTSSQTLEAQ